MIKTVIIDDEEDGCEALLLVLKKYVPEVQVLQLCTSPEEGIQVVQDTQPDLVFLDVQMPMLSGFDVLHRLSPVTFQIIFVSAHDQYAIKAIKFSALDYLLKPIDVDELVQAIRKVKERMDLKSPHWGYQSVLQNVRHKGGMILRLAVPSFEGIDFFDTEHILWCEAEGNYTRIFLANGEEKLISKNLKDFENILTDSGFCRVHHAHLINLRHVQKYVKGEGGYVVMSNDKQLAISRRKKEEFMALLNKV